MGAQQIRYEAGQTQYGWTALTDSGDATTFEGAVAPWSDVGRDYVLSDVRAYGLATGGAVTGNGTNDQVAVAALTAYMPGATGADLTTGLLAVAANAALSVGTRPTGSNKCIVSITVNSSGALAVVKGTDGASIVATRGAAGGPPLIPAASIEIGQVTLSGSTAAPVVTATDVSQIDGLSIERFSYPPYTVDRLNGAVTFAEPLPLIHTGGVARKVYARPAVPIFAAVPDAYDWVPADESGSVTSTQTYDGARGAASLSLNGASFSFISRDGISDPVLALKGESLWFEYKPDRTRSLPKQLTQGVLSVSRTNPASGNKVVTVNIAAERATADVVA